MTAVVALAGTGLAGWNFLKATSARQLDSVSSNAVISRKLEYFRENISRVESVDALMADRRLLDVALTAFGLQDDLPNKAFIRKVLAEGTIDDRSFANRLADRRYAAMSKAFGFDLTPPNTVISTFASKISQQFVRQSFEAATGDLDPNMRLGLSFERDLPELVSSTSSEDAFWFTVMGTPPVRRVFETALGIPAAASGIDVDRQLEIFKDKAQRIYGSSNPDDILEIGSERIIRDFLLRSEVANLSLTAVRGSVALSLLQAQPRLTF